MIDPPLPSTSTESTDAPPVADAAAKANPA